MYRLFFFFIFLFQISEGFSQRSHFDSGLFLSVEAIKNNTPDYTLEEVLIKEGKTKKRKLLSSAWMFNGAPTEEYQDHLHSVFVKKITKVDHSGENISIPIDGVIAIANENGIYFNVDKLFVKAGVVGAICHIPLQQINTAKYIDRPVDRKVDKVKYQTEQYLYKIETGELQPFDEVNIEKLIKDDHKLLDHFLKNTNRVDQLYLYVLKYNERNKKKK